jgi:hypothetical protein
MRQFSTFLPKWHVIKTKHTCRFGESEIGRTSGGWKFIEPTSLRSGGWKFIEPTSLRSEGSGNFSHPRCVQSRTHLSASMFVIKHYTLYNNTFYCTYPTQTRFQPYFAVLFAFHQRVSQISSSFCTTK